ncbi:MAG: hypothetical protein JO179_11815 [Solirubrobacterales bacterium]|nr:hypothetical protein [Solirubrobacterales bacterium]
MSDVDPRPTLANTTQFHRAGLMRALIALVGLALFGVVVGVEVGVAGPRPRASGPCGPTNREFS